MSINQEVETLRSFPVQIMPVENGLIVKRGSNEIRIGGEGSGRAVRIIFAATSFKSISKEDLCQLFPDEDRSKIIQILDELVRRRFLTQEPAKEPTPLKQESNADLFYWHFGTSAEDVQKQFANIRLVIMGVNAISFRLLTSLIMSGFAKISVLDHPLLRNRNWFGETFKIRPQAWPKQLPFPQNFEAPPHSDTFDCLIVTSDFGVSPVLSECNSWCVKSGRVYLPIFLDRCVGYIGPIVIPGETACFACLQARQISHLQNVDTRTTINNVSFEGQHVVGFHPTMPIGLAEFAAIELIKFYSNLFQPSVGTLIEVNLLAPKLTARKVLKIPRCPICSLLNTRPSTTPSQSVFSDPEKTGNTTHGVR